MEVEVGGGRSTVIQVQGEVFHSFLIERMRNLNSAISGFAIPCHEMEA